MFHLLVKGFGFIQNYWGNLSHFCALALVESSLYYMKSSMVHVGVLTLKELLLQETYF